MTRWVIWKVKWGCDVSMAGDVKKGDNVLLSGDDVRLYGGVSLGGVTWCDDEVV